MTATTLPVMRPTTYDRNAHARRRRPASGQHIGRGVAIIPSRHVIGSTWRATVA